MCPFHCLFPILFKYDLRNSNQEHVFGVSGIILNKSITTKKKCPVKSIFSCNHQQQLQLFRSFVRFCLKYSILFFFYQPVPFYSPPCVESSSADYEEPPNSGLDL